MLDLEITRDLTPGAGGAASPVGELVLGVGRGLPTLPSDGPLPPERNPALLYLAGLQSAESRRTQRSALGAVVRLFRGASVEAFPWHRLSYPAVLGLRTVLAERLAPATGNRYLGAVRGVLTAAWRLGLVDREAFEAARVKPIRGARVRRGRLVRPAELRQLAVTALADRRPSRGARDLAMVGVCYGGGLRRGEVARLDLASYDGASVVALGKGNKERRVPLAGPVRWAVDRWLEHRGRKPGPLFVRLGPNPKRITVCSVSRALARLAQRAGVGPLKSHDLRRTFISELLRAGADLSRVQKLAGHSDPKTTVVYDLREDTELEAAVQLLPFPWA